MARSAKSAEGTVMVSSLVVLVIYGYRKLIEPASSPAPASSPLRKVAGLESTPANAGQFTVAFGFTFFSLSVIALAAPELAAAFAILIATGDILTNGGAVFADINRQVKGPAAAPAAAGTPLPTGTIASGPKGTTMVAGQRVRITNSGQLH